MAHTWSDLGLRPCRRLRIVHFGLNLASILEAWESTKPNLTAMSNRAQNYISIGPKFAIHYDPIHSFAELLVHGVTDF